MTLKDKMQKLFEKAQDLDKELSEFCECLTPLLQNKEYEKFTDYDLLFQFLKIAGLANSSSRDIFVLFADLSYLAMDHHGIEFARKLFKDVKNLHSDGNCQCEICHSLDAELQFLEQENAQKSNIPKENPKNKFDIN